MRRRIAGALLLAGFLNAVGIAQEPPTTGTFEPEADLVALDQAVDWSSARLIVVQDRQRYKTLESFARESLAALTGREHLPGLSPIASLLEWLFNRPAYADVPLIRIKHRGLRFDFSTHLRPAAQARVRESGRMTLHEFGHPVVQRRIQELEPRFDMGSAIRKVRDTQRVAQHLHRILHVVPSPTQGGTAPWHPPIGVLANLSAHIRAFGGSDAERLLANVGAPIPGLDTQQAEQVLRLWTELETAWLARDAAGTEAALGELAALLPTLAPPGVYPSEAQRAAEARYYALGKFNWAWGVYLLAALVGVLALVTRWTWPTATAAVLVLAALALHSYGLALRWYILGRIPVANLFEAVVFSAGVGVLTALVLEWFYRTRILLVAAAVTGFVALITAGYVIPGQGTLTAIVGILDDVMLRIHTTIIIASYALLFLAAVIAAVYLFGYHYHRNPVRSAEVGVITVCAGLFLLLVTRLMFERGAADSFGADGTAPTAGLRTLFGLASVAYALLTTVGVWRKWRGQVVAALLTITLALLVVTTGSYDFIKLMAWAALGGGGAWAVSNAVGAALFARRMTPAADPAVALAAAGPSLSDAMRARPVLAGGAPGDERPQTGVPHWLNQVDWAHLIILNMAFVLLFVGVILGAVWADYSWGRPWGWDPKETFALNTWLIYAILIHVRFVTQRRGLWTAWLSIIGCLMMLFNWIFVNFFVVGLHSYA